MAKKIYLSPSDQDRNSYAYGNTNEAVQCRKIANACEKALNRCGFSVKNNQTSSMANRVSESNAWGADLHVCIHTNAFNGSVSGTRIFCYSTSGEEYKASTAIFNALAPITPGKSENVTTNPGLYEINRTVCPCVYIEAEFHDVPNIAKWIIEHTSDIGEAIAKGICKHYGVTYKEEPTNSGNVLYRVQVGAFSVKSNADAMLAKLKKAGFDGYITTSSK